MSALDHFGLPTAPPGRRARLPVSPGRLGLLWLPSVAVVALILLPVAYLILRALQAAPAQYAALASPGTLRIMANSLALTVIVTAGATALAVAIAWLLARTDIPGRRLWAILTPLPLVIPSYVGAYLFVAAFGPRGLIGDTLAALAGLERFPDLYGLPGASLVLILLTYPYVQLPVSAALRRMDPAQEESARSLGLSSVRLFLRVTLPQLRPAMTAGALLVALYTLRDFGAVSILRYTTFTRAIYIQYQSVFDRSSAALLSLVLVAITLLILTGEVRTRQANEAYASQSNTRRQLQPISLGAWRLPALLFVLGVTVLALIAPAGVLLIWLFRALEAGPDWLRLAQATWHSLSAASLSAGLIVAAGLPLAVLSSRDSGRLASWAERLSHLGFALPGIVVALAFVFYGIRLAPWLYQTLPLLVLAYLILFMPQAVGGLRAALVQVPAVLEEAGRSLGRNPMSVFRQVTLPLLRPGLLASFALVFLTSMKELQATLILGPLGFNTLATEIWSAVSEAFFARAAAPALVLILASSLPMAYFVLREEAV